MRGVDARARHLAADGGVVLAAQAGAQRRERLRGRRRHPDRRGHGLGEDRQEVREVGPRRRGVQVEVRGRHRVLLCDQGRRAVGQRDLDGLAGEPIECGRHDDGRVAGGGERAVLRAAGATQPRELAKGLAGSDSLTQADAQRCRRRGVPGARAAPGDRVDGAVEHEPPHAGGEQAGVRRSEVGAVAVAGVREPLVAHRLSQQIHVPRDVRRGGGAEAAWRGRLAAHRQAQPVRDERRFLRAWQRVEERQQRGRELLLPRPKAGGRVRSGDATRVEAEHVVAREHLRRVDQRGADLDEVDARATGAPGVGEQRAQALVRGAACRQLRQREPCLRAVGVVVVRRYVRGRAEKRLQALPARAPVERRHGRDHPARAGRRRRGLGGRGRREHGSRDRGDGGRRDVSAASQRHEPRSRDRCAPRAVSVHEVSRMRSHVKAPYGATRAETVTCHTCP
jgi:hypothetical protein